MESIASMLNKNRIITRDEALKGRLESIESGQTHNVLGTSYQGPFDDKFSQLIVGMGCFWGVERLFWQVEGVYTTAVGYCGGYTPNPTYDEVCSGLTGHNEVVLIVFDPEKLSLNDLLKLFWENHDPTQGLRQGNDRGSQYRSGVYCTTNVHLGIAQRSKLIAQKQLNSINKGSITTQITRAGPFYYAEHYHQQYLHKNPNGYCALKGVGITL